MQPLSCEVTLVRVGSAVTFETVSRVKQQLASLLDAPGHVILDLRDAILDSAGLGVVLSMQRVLELRGRTLLIVADDPQFFRLLERSGVTGALTLFRDAGEAVNHVLALSAPALLA